MRILRRTCAAALLAAAFFSSCGGRPAKTLRPVFPYGKALREAGLTAPELFPLTGEFKPRAISRFGKDYLGWDYAAKRLRLLDAKGKEKRSWPMDAGFVWVSADLALARSTLFEDGPDKGFTFALYRTSDKKNPEELWSGALDCFPSETLFADGGIVYLAGADRADTEHSVYRLRPGADAEKLLSAPKNADFMRLVALGDDVLAFASAREKAKLPLKAYLLENGAGVFTEIALAGLPGTVLCVYGYGFAFRGGFVVPLAMADGDLALARFEKKGGRLDAVALSSGAKGCYLPLGTDPDGSCFRYLARDDAEPDAAYLGRYDGEGVYLERIH